MNREYLSRVKPINALPMNRLVEYFKRKVAALNATKQARQRAEIEARFAIRERQGKLCITCNSTAVCCFDKTATADTIIKQLRAMRATAVEFVKNGQIEAV